MENTNQLNLKLDVKDLLHVLIFANSVVEKRNVLIELSHIKLIVKDNVLEVIATDRDLTLIQRINIQSFKDGQTSVSSATFTDIIRKIYDKEITLKQISGSEQLEIIGKNCHFNLVTLPADGFPSLEEMNVISSFKVSCKDFIRLIEHTQFSMSNEETRYNLNGIYLHNIVNECEDDGFLIHAAATDGHRLAVSSIKTSTQVSKFGVIVPRKTIQEIAKIIKDPENISNDIEILIGINKIKFLCNKSIMISKLIDGIFPEYENFIPKKNLNKLIINNKTLASSIDRISIITVDKFRAIKIALTQEFITISASGEAKGSAEEMLSSSDELEKYNYFGEEITIGFNPRYLTDVLTACKDDLVEVYFNDALSPALIKLPAFASDSFVIMPVKV